MKPNSLNHVDMYTRAAIDAIGWLVSVQIASRLDDTNTFAWAIRDEDIAAAIEAILEYRVDALPAIAATCRRRARKDLREGTTHFDRKTLVDLVRRLLATAVVCEYAYAELEPIVGSFW